MSRRTDPKDPYYEIRKLNPQLTLEEIQPYVDMKWEKTGPIEGFPKKPTHKREMQEYLMGMRLGKQPEPEPMVEEQQEPEKKEGRWIKVGKKEQQGLTGVLLVFVFAGGFAIANTILEAIQPGDGNNLLIAAGAGAGMTAAVGGVSYATGILKI